MQTELADMPLPRFRFPGGVSSDNIRPLVTPDNGEFFEALAKGRMRLPSCVSCGRIGRPFGYGCPWCGGAARVWVDVSSLGVVHSRVRYHRAYLPEFEPLVPYVVAAVRLAEGPVLYGRWLSGSDMPAIGETARAAVEEWADGFCALGFAGGDHA